MVEHDNFIESMRCMGFDHWIPCATASVMYLRKKRSQAVYCVLFQNYCVTKNQIMGTLFTNVIPLSTAFHLEYCKQLQIENHQEYLTLRRVIHRLCNIFQSTTQKHYKHPHFFCCYNYLAVCVNITDKSDYVTSNFVFNPAGHR